MQIDKSLSFLNGYVQQSLEKGAQPYISENERSGMMDVGNFRSQEQHEVSSHALRFEAYELPKPVMPSRVSPIEQSSSSELVPISEPSYHAEIPQVALSAPSVSDTGSLELKLKLDGVQRKWGRPTYSAASSTSNADTHKIQNGAPQLDAVSSSSSKVVSYDSKRQQVEISSEKQKLAASLFGGTSRSDTRQSSASQKVSKTHTHAAEKTHVAKNATSDTAVVERTPQPPPDLLDLGEATVSSSAQSVDPFKQLEGLLDLNQDASTLSSSDGGASRAPDIMSVYGDTTLNAQSDNVANLLSTGRDDANLLSGFSNAPNRNGHGGDLVMNPTQQLIKGPNAKESLEKDALVRQLGVTPTGQNPNLFRDLLG